MEIRDIGPQDYEQHFQVSASAFIWEYEPANEKPPTVPILGVFDEDGTLMADMEYTEHTANFHGKTVRALKIDGVATRPEYRRRGLIRTLFVHLEQQAPARGWEVTFLQPFSWNYYRKFGYDRVVRAMRVKTPMHTLAAFPRNCDVTLYNGAQKPELLALHNQFVRQYDLSFVREDDKRFVTQPFKEAQYTYLWHGKHAQARAYATFQVIRKTRTLHVREMAFADPEALQGILGFLRVYDGQVDTLEIGNLPPGSPVELALDSYEAAECVYSSSVAGRIYNIQSVLEKLDYPTKPGAFCLKIEDNLPKNNGLFAVEYGDGRVQVQRKQAGEADVTMTACAAARVLLGGEGFTPQQLAFLPGVAIHTHADALCRSLPAKATALFE